MTRTTTPGATAAPIPPRRGTSTAATPHRTAGTPRTVGGPRAASRRRAPGPPGRGAAVITGRSVPATLVRLRGAAAVLCALVGALTAVLLVLGWQANRSAAGDTEQLIRAQGIETNLLTADALATNAFLVGGLEPAEHRAAYDAALDAVSRSVADAAEAQPADRQVLAELNAVVLRYATTMELARANNRQGLPVGAAYLQSASKDLRATALPLVVALVTANSERAEASMGGQHPWLILVTAVLVLVLLGLVNQWVARRFRRRVNLGLAGAAGAVALLAVAAVAAAASVAGSNDSVRATSYATVVNGAAIRTAANDAKSDESLRLIARGSGQPFEDAWARAAKVVDERLAQLGTSSAPALATAWGRYAADHASIVTLDNGGQWDRAVAAATATGDGSASAHFSAFDTAVTKVLDDAGATATTALRGGTTALLLAAGLAVLLGAAAAASAWRGLSSRLEEYA